ncbi:MAG: HU family DNA-binding protein [Tannerella sp.]|jgi:nucleoid DNA-binding protein|nr:HU family DNA-binding protein [Tannerella sp.]
MNETLTSQHLVEILAGKTGRDKAEVETFFNELVTVVNEGIINEQAVEISGIGAFKVKLMKERKSRDANTQETITIPPYHKLAFMPAERFGKLVNRQFESFPSESRVMEGALPANLHISGEEEDEIEDEEIIDNTKTEIMEEKRYPMPPVPVLMSGRAEVDEPASANDSPAGGQQPEITGTEIMDEQTQLLGCPLEDVKDEETRYGGSPGEEKPDEDTQLLGCPLEDVKDEEMQYAGSPGEEKPDEETQLLGCPLEDVREEETRYAGSLDEGRPDEETQLLDGPLEDVRDEKKLFAVGFEKGNPDEETQLAAGSVNTAHAGPNPPPFNPTQIALAIVLLLVLCGGMWYLFATRGNKGGWISGDSFVLPGDSAAMEQARQKANVAPKNDTIDAGVIATTDSVSLAGTAAVESATAQTPPESSAKKKISDSGKKTSGSRTRKSPLTKAPATASGTSSGKVLTKVTMAAGSRLTLLALKYYGDKIFWVYIYDFNKAKIGSNPDIVPAGMELLIPAKEVYGIDANNAASCEKARLLQVKIKERR